jgi:hypothetical protein
LSFCIPHQSSPLRSGDRRIPAPSPHSVEERDLAVVDAVRRTFRRDQRVLGNRGSTRDLLPSTWCDGREKLGSLRDPKCELYTPSMTGHISQLDGRFEARRGDRSSVKGRSHGANVHSYIDRGSLVSHILSLRALPPNGRGPQEVKVLRAAENSRNLGQERFGAEIRDELLDLSGRMPEALREETARLAPWYDRRVPWLPTSTARYRAAHRRRPLSGQSVFFRSLSPSSDSQSARLPRKSTSENSLCDIHKFLQFISYHSSGKLES